MPMAHFECSHCHRMCFRHAEVHARMMRERGEAWCIVCTPQPYRAHISAQELCDVSQRLVAWALEHMAGAPAAR